MHVNTPRDQEAREQLADALADAEFTPIDEETGAFEVELEAESHDAAIQRVIDAIAAAGVDDHLQLAEHGPPRTT
jgi:ribose 1,5-bisphosphokinase PhnN